MDQLNLLLATLAGIGSAAIIGIVKKAETAVDKAWVSKLGNLTPLLVTMLTFVLPKVTTTIGLTNVPDGVALANAPLATCIAIACRELLVKVLHQGTPAAGTP